MKTKFKERVLINNNSGHIFVQISPHKVECMVDMEEPFGATCTITGWFKLEMLRKLFTDLGEL